MPNNSLHNLTNFSNTTSTVGFPVWCSVPYAGAVDGTSLIILACLVLHHFVGARVRRAWLHVPIPEVDQKTLFAFLDGAYIILRYCLLAPITIVLDLSIYAMELLGCEQPRSVRCGALATLYFYSWLLSFYLGGNNNNNNNNNNLYSPPNIAVSIELSFGVFSALMAIIKCSIGLAISVALLSISIGLQAINLLALLASAPITCIALASVAIWL